jgi:hypothetical protein
MDWNLKKMWPLATVTLLSFASLSAASSNGDACAKNPNSPNCCTNACNTGMSGAPIGVAPSARPMLCNNKGWIFDAELLIWRANQDGLWPTIENQNPGVPLIGSASNYTDSKFNHLHPKWDAGFKVAAGYNMAHDSWDVLATWTWFQNHAKLNEEADAESNPVETLTALWSAFDELDTSLNLPRVAEVHANWKLKLNVVDLELGRKMYVGQWLAVRPNIGLRGAMIRQHYAINYFPGAVGSNITAFDGTQEQIRMKNDFGGVGVKAGLNTQWNMGCGFSIYGDSALSIVYGAFDIEQREQNGPQATTNPSNTILAIKDNFHASRAIADLALGLRWEHQYPDSLTSVAVSIGWEHHVFFDQMNMKRFTTLNSSGTSTTVAGTVVFNDGGNLTTQGLTVGLRFDF